MRAWKAVGAICVILGGLASALEIAEYWQGRASTPQSAPPPGTSTEPPVSEPPAEDPPASETRVSTTSPPAGEPGTSPGEVERLVNPRVKSAAPAMAVVLDGDPVAAEMLEAHLVAALSTPQLRLITGYFKPAFKARGFFQSAYDGDSEALVQSGALDAVDWVFLGRVERSCGGGQIDPDLVTCHLQLLYKVLDQRGALATSGQASVNGAGFSEESARDRAIEMLIEQHGQRLVTLN